MNIKHWGGGDSLRRNGKEEKLGGCRLDRISSVDLSGREDTVLCTPCPVRRGEDTPPLRIPAPQSMTSTTRDAASHRPELRVRPGGRAGCSPLPSRPASAPGRSVGFRCARFTFQKGRLVKSLGPRSARKVLRRMSSRLSSSVLRVKSSQFVVSPNAYPPTLT